jgi:hypothetical protein
MLSEPWWADGAGTPPVVDSQTEFSSLSILPFTQTAQSDFTANAPSQPINQCYPYYGLGPFTNSIRFESNVPSWPQSSPVRRRRQDPLVNVVPDEAKWHTSNDAFIMGIRATKESMGDSEIVDSHAAFKAILLGWDVMEERQRTHPVWKALRQVDEMVFGNWQSKAQKIAMMFVCHRVLLVSILPPFNCGPGNR